MTNQSRGAWRGYRGGAEGHGGGAEGHGRGAEGCGGLQRGVEGLWKGHGGHGGVQRDMEGHWLPLATRDFDACQLSRRYLLVNCSLTLFVMIALLEAQYGAVLFFSLCTLSLV